MHPKVSEKPHRRPAWLEDRSDDRELPWWPFVSWESEQLQQISASIASVSGLGMLGLLGFDGRFCVMFLHSFN